MKHNLILVTGAAGFIGARFVEASNQAGHATLSVDKPDYFFTRPEIASFPFGTIIDREVLFDWLAQEKPRLSAVVHLGACTDTTVLDVPYLTEINLEYSKKIWNYCTSEQIPLVYASSAATYGDGSLGYDDDERCISDLKPLNPYGESKLAFDQWVLQQERQGHTPPLWSGFKFFNVYGFGERHKKKMASVVLHAYDQILSTGAVKLFKSHRADISDGHQKRDFIWVDDVINVLRFAIEKPISRGIYNLGTGEARTFLDLIRPVFAALEKKENITFIDTPFAIRERYQYFTEAKMTKLREAEYASPFTPLEKGVSKYIQQLVLQKIKK